MSKTPYIIVDDTYDAYATLTEAIALTECLQMYYTYISAYIYNYMYRWSSLLIYKYKKFKNNQIIIIGKYPHWFLFIK